MKIDLLTFAITGVLLTFLACNSTKADIDGFDMLDPQIWTYKQGDNGLPPAVDADSVTITNGGFQ